MANGKKDTTKPKLVENPDEPAPETPKTPETTEEENPETTPEVTPIIKPAGFSLDKFKSKRANALANVGTELAGLKHFRLADAKDFARLHPDEENYWSDELCFVSVPIKGDKKEGQIHLIDEDVALRWLSSGKIMRHRLALATKPYDVFFLCQVPTRNLDNDWNRTALDGADKAKTQWVQLVSRKTEGVESYKIDFAHDQDAFPEPKWPSTSLMDLIYKAFAPNCIIENDDHPGLLRLIGAKQNLA